MLNNTYHICLYYIVCGSAWCVGIRAGGEEAGGDEGQVQR